MQRRNSARLGPRCALIAGVLLGVASLALYQSAYAAVPPPYPGPPGLPGIPNGPTLGCNDSGTTNQTWVCNFNQLSTVTFKVDNRAAGTGEANSNGCVLIVVSFLASGEVQINANTPVKVNPGANVLTVEGVKTTSSGTKVVGLKLPFQTPKRSSNNECVTTTTTQPPTQTSTLPPHISSTTFPRETTIHRYPPTTLAKVLETPLVISPNKVILESSLLAGVLAAALCAGGLGAMWAGSARDVAPVGVAAEAAAGGAGPRDEPETPPPPPTPPPPVPPPPVPPPPVPPPPSSEPAAPAPAAPPPTAPPSASSSPIAPNAFVRPPADPNRGAT